MKGMVLAAGYGTRFRPATYEIPKPMVPMCNRPLVTYAVDSLLAAGLHEIVVNLHHLPEQIESFLLREYEGRCKFIFSFEPEILGTGGGVRKVRSVLEREEAFYLVNGDTVQYPPLEKLHQSLIETGALASLLLRHAPPDDRFTAVMFDGRYVTGFGNGRGEALMFAGAHALSRRIFERLPDREVSGLTEDVYIPATESGSDTIAGTVYDGLWFDIGTPKRYLSASQEILGLIVAGDLPPSAGSRMEGSSLIGDDSNSRGSLERAILGRRCRLATFSTIRDSVLWDGVVIGSGASVESSILARNVSLPPGSRLGNALVCRRLEGVEYGASVSMLGELVAKSVDPERELIVEIRGS